MSNNLFYSHNREIRGGFLRVMFEICTKTNKMCGFCGFATFDPKNQEYSKEKKKKDEYLSMRIRRQA